jgi:oligopeptide/dipeptide ABC transporter ATP-binding protein
MYLGRIVEEGPTEEIFANPRHPYTYALLESAPTLDKLMHLPEAPAGEIPDPRTKFVGCRYASRCPNVLTQCKQIDPPRTADGDRSYYCHNPMGAWAQVPAGVGRGE